jgi:hypothetical protein
MTEVVKGYRQLNAAEIDCINAVKHVGLELEVSLDELAAGEVEGVEVDQRWLAIARTEFQKAFMFLTRAIARPNGF